MVVPYERGAEVHNSNNYMTNIEVSYSTGSRSSADMKKTTRIKNLCGHGFLILKIFIRRAISLPFIGNGGLIYLI